MVMERPWNVSKNLMTKARKKTKGQANVVTIGKKKVKWESC